jgi:hypothetical protein
MTSYNFVVVRKSHPRIKLVLSIKVSTKFSRHYYIFFIDKENGYHL